MLASKNNNDHPLAVEFAAFVKDIQFPCVGAKSALARGTLNVMVARDLASAYDDLRIYSGIYNLAQQYTLDPELFQSFAVIFEGPLDLSEADFEKMLWQRLQSLSDKDALHGQPYDQTVSEEPEDRHFALSFGSQAFFAVGLHPYASRPARCFSHPVIVFNLRDQFEELRRQGRYEKLRASILDRDFSLAGSMNPMLARHGEISEARQYSGRRVASDWKCPYDPDQRAAFDNANHPAPLRNRVPVA